MQTIPLTRPFITDGMKNAVLAVLDSGMLTEGRVTARFEEEIAKYVGVRFAVACNNCTTGLEMALRALGLNGDDEVIVPDFTYPATAAAVVLAGGVAVIADVDPATMLLTPELAEQARTPKTRAVMPVPAFGNPLDYDCWREWGRNTGVRIVEDAAPALGAKYKGKPVGAFSDMTVFSFHPRKTLTTGEGGIVATNDDEWRRAMLSFKRFGMSVSDEGVPRPPFVNIGSNFKLSDLLAALGLEQLRELNAMVERRRSLAAFYCRALSGNDDIFFPETTEGGEHSYQTFCVFVPKRDTIMQAMKAKGVEVQIGTHVLHREPVFADHPRVRLAAPFPGAERAGSESLALPMFHRMTEMEQCRVVDELLNAMKRT